VTVGATTSPISKSFKYTRFSFKATVDEFAVLELENSFSDEYYPDDALMQKLWAPETPPSTSELWVHVESEGQFSYQKVFRKEAATWPTAVAVISVLEGKVTGISWDFGCFSCSSETCAPNTYRYSGEAVSGAGDECFVEDVDCKPGASHAPKDCDLKVKRTHTNL